MVSIGKAEFDLVESITTSFKVSTKDNYLILFNESGFELLKLPMPFGTKCKMTLEIIR